MQRVCRVCHNSANNKVHIFRETFYRTLECFEYMECTACGCLSITEIPQHMGNYYPEWYYSKGNLAGTKLPRWKRLLKRQRTLYWLTRRNLLGRVLARGERAPWLIEKLRQVRIGIDDHILDVGSGNGSLLVYMATEGFMHLTGADPFIDGDIAYPNGVVVFQRDIAELDASLNSSFTLIMFNDSFEHLPAPRVALEHARRLLTESGTVMIRTPVADSFAWHSYGPDWHKLDAPRHFVIHTRKSLGIAAEQAGLRLIECRDESDETQFWKSEVCRAGVPLFQAKKDGYSAELLAHWRAEAHRLNALGEGDRVCCYLNKA
jgi:SAM-dependent methyltransferase